MTPEQKQLFIILDEILIKEISDATPGKGRHVANAWEIEFIDGEFYLVNNYGLVAKYLDEGVSPHTIYPKTKKMLRFELDTPPVFRDAKLQQSFNERGIVFFFKNKEPVLGYVREGSKVFCLAKKVEHPGYEGRKFIRKVLDDEKMWDKILSEYLKGLQ